ncbi:MAG: hypothetical protein RLY93_12440 [Sumerlaeia bacterium]
MKFLSTTLIVLALTTSAAYGQQAQDQPSHGHAHHGEHETAKATSQPTQTPDEAERIGDPWPLDTCVVSGQKLGSMGDPVIRLHEGREVRFCCAGCIGMFEKDPAKYLAAADKKIEEQQMPRYPLDHCIIDTSEELSEDPAKNSPSVVGNRLFLYCCPPCDKKVRAEPAKYIAILDEAAIEKQTAGYPLDTCVVSGQPLDSMGGAVNVVLANQLVKLCCAGCEKKVEANPAATLAKIDAARTSADSEDKPAN